MQMGNTQGICVALFTRAWIEIFVPAEHFTCKLSRPLHEGVDWNIDGKSNFARPRSRPLHEGVDWNSSRILQEQKVFVALFTRAWIEMSDKYPFFVKNSVALFTRAWIEIFATALYCLLYLVALFTRAWIEIVNCYFNNALINVALFTRAWIEISIRR